MGSGEKSNEEKANNEYANNWLKKQVIIIEQLNNDIEKSSDCIRLNLEANILAQRMIESSEETKSIVMKGMYFALSSYENNKIKISNEVLELLNKVLENK